MDELKAMLKSREPLYSQAELTVDTSRHSPEQSVSLIINGLADSLRREELNVPPAPPAASARSVSARHH
jgi:hypothetical protein